MSEKISGELLHVLGSSKSKVQMAQLNHQAVLQEVAEFYKLVDGDNLNMETGEITRKDSASPTNGETSMESLSGRATGLEAPR